MCEHVEYRVWLALDPELVAELNIVRHVEDFAFTGVRDHTVVIWRGYRPDLILESAGEEVIPGFVAVVLGFGVAMEEVLESVGCGVRGIGDHHHVLLADGSKPALLVLLEHFGGLG